MVPVVFFFSYLEEHQAGGASGAAGRYFFVRRIPAHSRVGRLGRIQSLQIVPGLIVCVSVNCSLSVGGRVLRPVAPPFAFGVISDLVFVCTVANCMRGAGYCGKAGTCMVMHGAFEQV